MHLTRKGKPNRRKSVLGQKSGFDEDTSDSVRVNVGSGTSVLEVTVTLFTDMSGDSDGCSSVGDTGRELGDGSGLVLSSQSLLVVFTVDSNVF